VKIRLHAQALADLDEAALWYDEQQPGLGDELLAEPGQHFSMLVENPTAWARPSWVRARRLARQGRAATLVQSRARAHPPLERE
jgi:hypothetical protein